mgnify:CR=1 FL=1
MTVPRNPLARYTAWHLRIRRLVQFILAGAVYHNALTSCATRVCCACLDEITCVAVRYLKLRTGCERHGRKKSSAVPLFRSGRRSPISAGLSSKGKVGVQRGGNRRLSLPFLPPPRGAARSRRPQTANPPLRFSGKLSARKGTNTLTQLACPAQPLLKKLPPGQGVLLTQLVCPAKSGSERLNHRNFT